MTYKTNDGFTSNPIQVRQTVFVFGHLPRVMKRYSPTGRRNHSRPLKRLLDTGDRNGSTSGPTPLQLYDDDDDDVLVTCYTLSH